MPSQNNELRNALADEWGTNWANGTLSLRTGEIQANPELAVAGTEIVSIPLGATPFSVAASNGVVTRQGTPLSATAGAGGTIGHGVFLTSGDDGTGAPTDGQTRYFVDVVQGGGELNIDNEVVTNGQTVNVNSFTYTQPAS